MDVGPCTYRI
jgi:hypothetical protein